MNWKPHYLLSAAVPGHDSMLAQTRESMGETILDCGAFTYYKQGLPTPNVTHHTNYALKLKELYSLSYLAQLDVIGNPSRTIENYKYQRRFGFSPVCTLNQDMDSIPSGDRDRLLLSLIHI